MVATGALSLLLALTYSIVTAQGSTIIQRKNAYTISLKSFSDASCKEVTNIDDLQHGHCMTWHDQEPLRGMMYLYNANLVGDLPEKYGPCYVIAYHLPGCVGESERLPGDPESNDGLCGQLDGIQGAKSAMVRCGDVE